MRIFILGKSLYQLEDGQYTSDEIKENGIGSIACAPSGAVDVTEYADDIKAYAGTHIPSLVDGKLIWVEKVVELTVDQHISEIDAQLLALDAKKVRPMSAILAAGEGDDTSEDLAYLSELEAQAVVLRAERASLSQSLTS